jgi:hypothetical protein
MKAAALYCIWFLCLGVILRAGDYCSLTVRVTDPAGREVEARVSVEERNGRSLEHDNKAGGIRFCDLGITPVTVTVGDPNCDQVIVKDVPLQWGRTSEVSVIYDRKPCLIDSPPVAACQFLLRFVDSRRKPAGGVSLKIATPYEGTENGDNFGRILVRIPAGQDLRAVATLSGYRPAEVQIPCTRENQKLERYVMFEKQGR